MFDQCDFDSNPLHREPDLALQMSRSLGRTEGGQFSISLRFDTRWDWHVE